MPGQAEEEDAAAKAQAEPMQEAQVDQEPAAAVQVAQQPEAQNDD